MNEYQIEILDDGRQQKFVPVNAPMTEQEAWYWVKRIRELGGTAVITHQDDKPF